MSKYPVLLAYVMIAAATAAPLTEEQYQYLFAQFSRQYNRSYEIQNVFSKYQTFKNNVELIISHNSSQQPFKMGINQFADQTSQEFKKFLGLKPIDTAYSSRQIEFVNDTLESIIHPKNAEFIPIDWTEKEGIIQAVKDQGQCGSCWAFSATGSLEPLARIAGKAGPDLDLSEQYLMDCAYMYGNDSCYGGLMDAALKLVVERGGVPDTKDYPYTASDEECQMFVPLNKSAKIKSYKTIRAGNAHHLEALHNAPISVAVDASSSGFQFYTSGVLPASKCSGTLNHGVVMVGAGEDRDTGSKFFKLRNSWGSSWGDNGYIKIEAGVDAEGKDIDACGCITSPFNVQPFY